MARMARLKESSVVGSAPVMLCRTSGVVASALRALFQGTAAIASAPSKASRRDTTIGEKILATLASKLDRIRALADFGTHRACPDVTASQLKKPTSLWEVGRISTVPPSQARCNLQHRTDGSAALDEESYLEAREQPAASSTCVFITIGPYQAMGSRSAWGARARLINGIGVCRLHDQLG